MKKNKPYCTIILIAVNVLVFLYLSFKGDVPDSNFMLEHGAMYIPAMIGRGEYYRLFTHMFLHFGFDHLMSNMVGLAFLGDIVERELGRVKYLIVYLGSGLAGGLLTILRDMLTNEYRLGAGASGAIFGLMGGVAWIMLANRDRLGTGYKYRIILMIGASLYYGFADKGVNNTAHVGGLIVGFLLTASLYWKSNRKSGSEPLF